MWAISVQTPFYLRQRFPRFVRLRKILVSICFASFSGFCFNSRHKFEAVQKARLEGIVVQPSSQIACVADFENLVGTEIGVKSDVVGDLEA